MKENFKLGIFEASASLTAVLTFIFLFLPCYHEADGFSLSMMQIAFGNTKTEANGLLIFAFILLVVGVLASIALTVLLFLNKTNEMLTMILAIVGGILVLAGGVILMCGIFITGLDKMISELGLVQGVWGFSIGFFLVPIFALASLVLSYPCGLIVLHHKDLADAKPKETVSE